MSKRELFAMIPDGAADMDLDGLAFRVLIVMASRASKDRYVWVTQKAVANRLGVSHQAVSKAIERLVRAHLLVRAGHYVQPGTNRWRNRYYIPLYLHVATTGRIVADEAPHDSTLDGHDSTVAIHDSQSQARTRARNRPYETDPMKQKERSEVERAEDQQQDQEPIQAVLAAVVGGGVMGGKQERSDEGLHKRPRSKGGSDVAHAEGQAIKARRRQAVGDGPEPQPRSKEEQLRQLRELER